MLGGLQADRGIQNNAVCSLLSLNLREVAVISYSEIEKKTQRNTGMGEMEDGTFVMVIPVTVTLTL